MDKITQSIKVNKLKIYIRELRWMYRCCLGSHPDRKAKEEYYKKLSEAYAVLIVEENILNQMV